jgi:hypothetical protein
MQHAIVASTFASMRTARNYIGDEWCVPAAATWREIVNPATG